jgi:hypothetical protein
MIDPQTGGLIAKLSKTLLGPDPKHHSHCPQYRRSWRKSWCGTWLQLAKRFSIPALASMDQLKIFELLRGFDDYLLR